MKALEFLGQGDDDARRASHVAESVDILVLDHLADEFGAVGAQASDSVVEASTVNMTLRRPSVFGGAIAGSISTNFGLRNLVSSSRPCPSGVRINTMSTRTPSSPLTRSTHGPSTGLSPSIVIPSAVKKALAAARSSTTTLMWCNALIVMSLV